MTHESDLVPMVEWTECLQWSVPYFLCNAYMKQVLAAITVHLHISGWDPFVPNLPHLRLCLRTMYW